MEEKTNNKAEKAQESKSTQNLTYREIVQIAAEAGARAALQAVREEQERATRETADRRLRNTKLLLKNYRVFKIHAENALYELSEAIPPEVVFTELMKPGKDSNEIIESIKLSAARTATIVKHIELMMQLYHGFCFTMGGAEDQRRWRIINDLFIRELPDGEKPPTIQELAKEEEIAERTVYKDIDAAAARIATFIFGIDGTR